MAAEEKELKSDEVMTIVKEIQSELEKAAPNFEKVGKLEGMLEAQEVTNQELTKKAKEAEAREAEAKERMDVIEKELARSGRSTKDDPLAYRESGEYKALEHYVQFGKDSLTKEHKDLMRTDVDTQGGYLVIAEMDNMITKKIIEVSPIRSVARVRTVASKSLEMPVRNTIPESFYEGEAEKAQESNSTYQAETVTNFRHTVVIPITADLLMNSSFSMDSELTTDTAESFAQKEGALFIAGSGFKQPSGFTVDDRILATARVSAVSGTIGFDDMMLLTGDLKTGYNPVYVLNRRTLAFLRTLKGGDGHPIWLPGMNGVIMNTINGFPYIIANDMADIASGSISVALGDFQRGYTITDRTGMTVIRDEITEAASAIVLFTFRRWNTGQVTLPEAIQLLQTKA